jgi:hypothetical protein
MEVIANEFTIKLDNDELFDLASDVKQALMASIKEHWVYHRLGWEENEKKRLERLKSLYISLSRIDMYRNVLEEIQTLMQEAEIAEMF